MPHCAVIWCNNQSKNVNKYNSCVSYHKFPKDPYIKDKWILATGKYNWFPQKHDTICSDHFEAASYKKKSSGTSRSYLSSDAIPTLKLHPIFKEMSGGDPLEEPAKEAIKDEFSNTQDETTPNIQDTPQRRKLKLSMLRAQETIKRQRLQIKRLRAANTRLSKKLAKMDNVIEYLREQSAITDEDITTLQVLT